MVNKYTIFPIISHQGSRNQKTTKGDGSMDKGPENLHDLDIGDLDGGKN